MTLNPPLSLAPRFPLTFLIALASIGLSLRWWIGHSLAGCEAPDGNLLRAPWVLLTATLPHVSVVHLFFNLSWWWYFASRLEIAWGSGKFLGAIALFAIISSAGEEALFGPGVGLSGIIYGLCTLLWQVQHKYPVLQGSVTKRTLQLFAAWFVICVILTVTNILPIGNAAHGFGALAGWLLGRAIREPRTRLAWIAALLGLLVATLVGATIARPWVNFSNPAARDAAAGFAALKSGDSAEAARCYERAIVHAPQDPDLLVNLGIAYSRSGRPLEALEPFQLAVKLDPSRRDALAPSIASILDHKAAASVRRSNLRRAREQVSESLAWNLQDTYAKQLLDWIDAHPITAHDRLLPQSTSENAPSE